MSNKEQGKGWRRPSHSKHYSYAFVYVRPMAITRVCADYNRYLKIGPNHKKRVLDCRARQALFATTTIICQNNNNFRGFSFWDPPYLKRANFECYNIASKHENKHTHKPQKTQWWTPSHVHVVEPALFAKCKPNVGPILGTIHIIEYYYFNKHLHTFKFSNPGYRHRSRILKSSLSMLCCFPISKFQF
jgi:hypothetical protein